MDSSLTDLEPELDDDFVFPSPCPSPVVSSWPALSRSPSPSPADESTTSVPVQPQSGPSVSSHLRHSFPSTVQEDPVGSTATSQPIQHSTFWYHDGSIILHVQLHLFKVHQTVLAAHSEVFAGLFEQGGGGGKGKRMGILYAEESIDGCPVVQLHGDDWMDVEVLLKAIYEPTFWDSKTSSTPLPTLLPPLTSLLKLSSKYIIPTIRTRCIYLLQSKLPATYEAYLARTTPSPSSSSTPSPSSSLDHEKYDSDTIMLSIHLSRTYDIPIVLPYLFYCLSRLSHRRILDHREGDVSWYIKTLSLIARDKLRLAECALSYAFLYAFRPSPQCLSPPLCSLSHGPRAEWREVEGRKKPSPLKGYTRWDRLGVCRECVEVCKSDHERGRREVWERLPSLVGVARGWEELVEGVGWELKER